MKILITILMALFISSNASAGELDIETIDRKDIRPLEDESYMHYSTTCIDGYKFLTFVKQISQFNGGSAGNVRPKYTYSTSLQNEIVQFYEEKDGRAVPAKC